MTDLEKFSEIARKYVGQSLNLDKLTFKDKDRFIRTAKNYIAFTIHHSQRIDCEFSNDYNTLRFKHYVHPQTIPNEE